MGRLQMPIAKNGIYFIQQLDNPRPYGKVIVLRNSGFPEPRNTYKSEEALFDYEEMDVSLDKEEEKKLEARKKELYMQDI